MERRQEEQLEVEAWFFESATILRRENKESEQHRSVLERTRISYLTSQHEEAMVRLLDAALAQEIIAKSRNQEELPKLEWDKESAFLSL
jgi:hypothetical protein